MLMPRSVYVREAGLCKIEKIIADHGVLIRLRGQGRVIALAGEPKDAIAPLAGGGE